jgi:hypothetical protein
MTLEILDWMQENDFTPNDSLAQFDKGTVRIEYDDNQLNLYAFDDESMSIVEWKATIDDCAPVSVLAALVNAALAAGAVEQR